ncbi:GNAT family N-acetyltransferase [Postechiella marina]|uniref:GNAT family N-acetyltransferase n=1 Tax=Postechiella marina TaxID=943941 RepID=A0ABP8C7N4_9FLAO
MKAVLKIELRPTNLNDLDTLFLFQIDAKANYLSAFTSKNPLDKKAYIQKWTSLLSNKKINAKTILLKNKIIGSIAKFEMEGHAEVTYWVAKAFWNKGVATLALTHFLKTENKRPIYARVAFDNLGSKKVLKNCGFTIIGKDKGFANARNQIIEEFIFELK